MQTIMAAFNNSVDADKAVRDLETMGYDTKDLSVITQENQNAAAKNQEDGTTKDHVVSGMTTGGAVGGLAGLLVGLGAIPALAGLLIGGPIVGALGLTGVAATTASGAITGALAGGLVGALTSIGVNNEDAQAYNEAVQKGGVLIAVPVEQHTEDKIKSIFQENHASQIKDMELKQLPTKV